MKTHRTLAAIISLLALAACNRPAPPPAPEPTAPEASQSPLPPPPPAPAPDAAPTPPVQPAPMPEGSFAAYQCDDGTQVEVRFDGRAATVTWADGHAAQLTQSAPTVEGQPQVYANPAVRLERNSDGLQLRQRNVAPTHCTETEASA